MTFTWDSTSIATTTAKIRHLIGDTTSTDYYLTDEQIAFEYSECAEIYLAAANCCDRICAAVAKKVDRSGTGFSASRSQLFQHYKDLGDRLREKANQQAGPYWSEHSEDDKDTVESDTDFLQPSFKVGSFDNT